MLDQQSVGLAKYFLGRYTRRSALIIGLLILSGFAEGFGIVTVLPLLQLAGGEGNMVDSELTRRVVDGLAVVGLSPTLPILLAIIILGMTVKAGFLWLATKQVGYTAAHVATDLRLMLLRALLGARWGYFTSQPAGHISNAIGTEALRASASYKEACFVLAGIIQVLVYLAVAVLVSWQIALFALVGGIGAMALLGVFVRAARQAGSHQTSQMKSLIGRLTDALQGIKPIKAMGREAHLWPLLREETLQLNRAQEQQILATETRKLFQEPLLVLMLAAGLFAAIEVGDQPFSSVMVMAFLFYRLVTRLHNVQAHYQTLANGESAFWSMYEGIRLAEGQRETGGGKRQPPSLRESITLESVSFSYGAKRVLENASLMVPAGQLVALVGPSGAGKTTIADLIIGLYQPDAGEVLLDGVPLREVDLKAWRHLIGYVPQEMFLFHDTILRNVTLGDDSIGRDRVKEALVTAGAWDFVSRLPGGLDTVVGERGSRLSGGQRQRIAIARALVGRPKLLILDEVTTSLDPETEAAIIATLLRLRGQITVVSISHQTAMQDSADVVYLVSGGTVEELRTERPATVVPSS